MLSHRYDTFYGIAGALAITIMLAVTTTMDERDNAPSASNNYQLLREAILEAVKDPQTDKETREAFAQAYCGNAGYVLTEKSLTCIPKRGKKYEVAFH